MIWGYPYFRKPPNTRVFHCSACCFWMPRYAEIFCFKTGREGCQGCGVGWSYSVTVALCVSQRWGWIMQGWSSNSSVCLPWNHLDWSNTGSILAAQVACSSWLSDAVRWCDAVARTKVPFANGSQPFGCNLHGFDELELSLFYLFWLFQENLPGA